MGRSPESLERSRQRSREAKQARRGTCVDCGAETRYAGKGEMTPDGVALRCLSCSHAKVAERQRGAGPLQQELVHLLEWRTEMARAEIQRELGISRNHVGPLLDRMLSNGQIVRVGRGRYRLSEGAS